MEIGLLQAKPRWRDKTMIHEDQPIALTEAQLKEIIRESVEAAMTRLGVDASNPLDMQRDFQHLRDWRLSVETVKAKGVVTMMGILITGVCAVIWLGFKAAINN